MGKEFLCLSREPGSGGESCLEVVDEVAADATQSSRRAESEAEPSGPEFGRTGSAISALFAARCRQHESHGSGERRRSQL